MEPYEKWIVDPEFLNTVHGQIACEKCHGGDSKNPDWQTSHKGVVKDPTYPDPRSACGECHPKITRSAASSLHYTLASFDQVLRARAGTEVLPEKIEHAKNKHCRSCHSSCGQCHVSRPDYVNGGFLDKHHFQGKPPMEVTCAACHGGRIFWEFTGEHEEFEPDVHFAQQKMNCMSCHTAAEMHADARGVGSRYEISERPSCVSCHTQVASGASGNEAHDIHVQTVACQVCHSQPSKSCFSCHVGTDTAGLPYYRNEETRYLLKIGLNPRPSKEMPQRFVVVSHPATGAGLFDAYEEGALADFDALPTWKLDTPHNIQRKTAQNAACGNCHGNVALFLKIEDLHPAEVKANIAVVVPDSFIPERSDALLSLKTNGESKKQRRIQ